MKLLRILNEIEVTDPELEAKIKEYARLSDEIDKKKAELKKLEKEFAALDIDLRAILESLDAAKERILRTKELLVTIKVSGYESRSSSYKDAFEYLMTKVNSKIKNLGQEALDKTSTIKKVVSKLSVQKIEATASDVEYKASVTIEKLFKNFIPKLNSIDVDLDHVENLLS